MKWILYSLSAFLSFTTFFMFDYFALAALTDNFESYTLGNLNGQGSWSGDTNFQVENSVVNSGTQAESHTSTLDKQISKSFTAQAHGIQSFYFRTTNNVSNNNTFVMIYSGATQICFFDSEGNLDLIAGTNATMFSSFSTNTWYHVEIEYDAAQGANGQVRGRVNGGAWTSWLNGKAAFTTVDTIIIQSSLQAASTAYTDDYSETPLPSNAAKPSTDEDYIIPFLLGF